MTTDAVLPDRVSASDVEPKPKEGDIRAAFTEAWFDLELSIVEIKELFGFGDTSMYRHVFVFGLPKRPLLQPAGKRKLRQLLCKDEKTVAEIAEVLGHRKIAVTRALRFHGLLPEGDQAGSDGGALPDSMTAFTDGSMTVEQALGRELRDLRQRRGWTRKMLLAHMESDVSLQTLATYELGTRKCSVTRLFELCLALDARPVDVIAAVQGRVLVDDPWRISLDLREVVADLRPELTPLHRWAENILSQKDAPDHFMLEGSALPQLANLCGIPVDDLESMLRTMSTHLAL
ncbi:helix-turn-helix domain-containing protein [Amycolatopsis sp. lyj-84]|uniref:helix-turn-helix domain-containing protein n=1 Tax=Amycolatopsis sp. lyj-84 TaxID=2789284 RepID=UPI00397E52D3